MSAATLESKGSHFPREAKGDSLQGNLRLSNSKFSEAEIRKMNQDLILLKDDSSDPKFGSDPRSRPIREYLRYGFIVLDKPAGPTSHEVASWIRKMFDQERTGYSGTLDPPVSGILPIGLGDATKALSALLLGPKEYLCVARIHDPVPEHVAENTFSQFVGEIYQRPPQRSSVRRTTRTREIYELELIERVGNLILLRVLCEAGTYIRKLVYDAGEIMIVGATMAELRRTKVCQLGEGDLVRMHDLFESKATFDETGSDSKIKKLVRPVEEALVFLPQIRIRDSAVESICQGAQLAIPGIVSFSKDLKKGDIVRVLSLKGELIAIAETSLSSEEIQKADHGIAAVTRRVIMRTGTYPKMWKSKDDETLDVSMELLKKSVLDSLEREDRTQV